MWSRRFLRWTVRRNIKTSVMPATALRSGDRVALGVLTDRMAAARRVRNLTCVKTKTCARIRVTHHGAAYSSTRDVTVMVNIRLAFGMVWMLRCNAVSVQPKIDILRVKGASGVLVTADSPFKRYRHLVTGRTINPRQGNGSAFPGDRHSCHH